MGDIADQHSEPVYLREGYWDKQKRKNKQRKSRDKEITELKTRNKHLDRMLDQAEGEIVELKETIEQLEGKQNEQ